MTERASASAASSTTSVSSSTAFPPTSKSLSRICKTDALLSLLRSPPIMQRPRYSSSPYFCLSDLAKNWPSADRSARREIIMITDGVDYYHLQYDPEDPYVQAAIDDSVRANLVVYSIYWRSTGPASRGWYENNAGQ